MFWSSQLQAQRLAGTGEHDDAYSAGHSFVIIA